MAIALGAGSITRMLSIMPTTELMYWLQKPEQFGDRREDLRASLIASSIANYAGKCLAEGESVEIDRYLSLFAPVKEKPVNQEELDNKIRLVMSSVMTQQKIIAEENRTSELKAIEAKGQ